MKKIAKRGLALLLMLVMCLPLGMESASAADDTPLAGVDGVVDVWKWTKVKTQADLPDARATRTVGGKTETYDYALLITYEYKGTKYFMNFAPENRRTSRGFEMRDRFWLPATELPEGVDSSLDVFRTKKPTLRERRWTNTAGSGFPPAPFLRRNGLAAVRHRREPPQSICTFYFSGDRSPVGG